MKPYERRAENRYPYFKLATYDSISCTYRDGKKAFPTYLAAAESAIAPGTYRISKVTDTGRTDFEPFTVRA